MDKVTVGLQGGFTQRGASVLQSVRRPAYLTSKTGQLVVYVRDTSPSMHGQKAADATAAGIDLVDELAKPENKDGFTVAVVDFAGHAAVVQPASKATAIAGRLDPIDTSRFGGSTNITDGLRKAGDAIRADQASSPEGRMKLKPVVILFSDGQANEGGDPRTAANDVKRAADLVTVAFGSDADEATLRDLATSSQHFYRCRNGRELRSFLASVGKTLTQTMSRGTNATAALTQLGQQNQ